jgi:CubicO group peptidase (beta-lactamase class C family)
VLAEQDRFSGELQVSVNGRLVTSQRYGAAATPAPSPTVYPIASLTKTVTAMAVLLLAQQGRLALTDPLAKFFPEIDAGQLTSKGRPVTLDDLLGHRSGLVGMQLLPAQLRADPQAASVTMLRKARLAATPGSHRSYSNEGFVILGEVIRRVSGQRYDRFVDQAISKPLGLADTAMALDEPQRRRLLPGLVGSLVGLHPARSLIPHRLRHDDSWPGAADGGLYSTAADLQRLFQALFQGRLLRDPWLAMMIAPREGGTRGLITTRLDQAGARRVLWHNGETPESGYQSFAGFLPQDSTVVVVLANVDDTAVDLTGVVLDALENLPARPPARWSFGRTINTVYALRLHLIAAGLGLFSIWWRWKRPRRDRAEDLSAIAGGFILMSALLVEARTPVFVAGSLATAVLSGLVLRRPAPRPWTWRGQRSWTAMGLVLFAAATVLGVLLFRQLS